MQSTYLGEVAFFNSCRSTKGGKNQSFASFLEAIKAGQWANDVRRLRATPYKSLEYQSIKEKLPCFMLSASTRTGGHKASDIDRHSGGLQLDIDGLGHEKAVALRDQLANDPHVYAAWLSPGASGVKAVMLITADLNLHQQAFAAAREYIAASYGVEIDKQCSDPCRLCFVSFDPELRLNSDATPMPMITQNAQAECDSRGEKENSSATSLPSTACLLPTTYYPLHNSEIFGQFPSLKPLYLNLVVDRFPSMQPGLRNAALCELIPRLYSAIHPRFILPFAETFYAQHDKVFTDTLQRHLHEAQSLLKGTADDFADAQLSGEERAVYAQIQNDMHQCAFRICHALAICENEACPPPLFFLSCEKLAHRLGCLDMQAHRILKSFWKEGVIRVIEVGQRRAKDAIAKATRYQWLLPSKLVRNVITPASAPQP